MRKRSLYLSLIVLLFGASFYITRKIKNHTASPINLPGIVLKDLNGNAVDITTFAGKPLVVNFWGTWCGPCRQELPLFENASSKFSGKVNFLLISDEPLATLIKFKNDNNYTFFYSRSLTPFNGLGITSVPATYFYSVNGTLTGKTKDLLSEEKLNGFIDEMIKDR